MDLRWTWLVGALLGSCRTVETRTLSSAPDPVVRVARHARSWEVFCAEELVGRVILFEEHGLARDSVYVVRNTWDQDLGIIDGLGRAFRYLPHEVETAWVGSGTIAAGTREILGAPSECVLVERAERPAQPDSEAGGSAEEPARQADSDPSGTPPAGGGLPQYR